MLASLLFLQFAWHTPAVHPLPGCAFRLEHSFSRSAWLTPSPLSTLYSDVTFSLSLPSSFYAKQEACGTPPPPTLPLCSAFLPLPHSMYCLLAFNIIYLLILFILWVYFVH